MTAPALTNYAQGVGAASADNFNTFEQTCDTVADLRAFVGTQGVQVAARGLATAFDGGGGVYGWQYGTNFVDNNGTVIVPYGFPTGAWTLLSFWNAPGSTGLTELWLKRDFGAAGNGVADDTTAVNNWVAAVISSGSVGRAEPGVFKITGNQWTIDLAPLSVSNGYYSTPGVLTTAQQTGFWLQGSGKAMTIFDVSACTNPVSQFLLTDTNAGGNTHDSFYVRLTELGVKGDNPGGRAATFGPDEVPANGSVFPHAINDLVLDIIVQNLATTTGTVGVRLNNLVTCYFPSLQVNGAEPLIGTGTTYGVEIAGSSMCTGRMIIGGWVIAVRYLNGYSFANSWFGCDLEILQNVFQFDSPFGGSSDEWTGQFVWGAVTSNPATSGQDGTTPFAICNAIDGFVGITGNIASSATPIVTGPAANQIIFSRGLGQFQTTGNRPIVIQSTDGTAATLELISGTGSDSSAISQVSNTLFVNNGAGGISLIAKTGSPVTVDRILAYAADGTQKQSGDHTAVIAQPTMPLTGLKYTNTNIFAVFGFAFAGSISVATVYDSVGGSYNWNPQVAGEAVPFYLPPGWAVAFTYTGSPAIRIQPAG